jgi:predicted RNase H-like nuclease
VDLAWQSERNPSAAALMLGDRSGANLVEVAEPLRSIGDVLAYIRRHATSSTVIAIDAPLIIANDEGQRSCETLVGRRYGARHASCHTSNRTLYPNAASTRLAAALEADGFVHAPGVLQAPAQRIMLESIRTRLWSHFLTFRASSST